MSAPRRVFARGQRAGRASVDMAPLIDMVFILLIFFMVTTSFVRETGVEVTRPESSLAEPVSEGYLTVSIDASGGMHVAGERLPHDSIRGVESALEESGKRRVLIQADREVPTHLLLSVLDTCRRAGADHVDVAAVKETR